MPKLESSPIFESDIIIGTWSGSAKSKGWSPKSSEEIKEAQKTYREALEQGIPLDCAQVYGQEEVAKAMKDSRKKFQHLIATKCGTFLTKEGEGPFTDNSPQRIQDHIHNSLKTLGIDCLELVQIHWPETRINHSYDPRTDDIIATLIQLRQEGKLKHFGLSNYHYDHLKNFRDDQLEAFSSNQIFYNILKNIDLQIFRHYAHRNKDIKILGHSTLANSLLTTGIENRQFPPEDMRHQGKHPLFRKEIFTALISALNSIENKYGISREILAIQFSIEQGVIPIVGAHKQHHLTTINQARNYNLNNLNINRTPDQSITQILQRELNDHLLQQTGKSIFLGTLFPNEEEFMRPQLWHHQHQLHTQNSQPQTK